MRQVPSEWGARKYEEALTKGLQPLRVSQELMVNRAGMVQTLDFISEMMQYLMIVFL